MFDIVTVGHFVMDLIISPRITNPCVTLGGPPTFVSLSAKKLGAKVGVLSKVGEDFGKYAVWLRDNNIDLSHVKIVKDISTTSFILTYNGNKRKLVIKNVAPSFVPKDIPLSLNAQVVHIAPVANEVSIEIIRKLRKKAPLLSFDPQGFLRKSDKTGVIRPKKLDDMSVLRHFDIFKSSIDEIRLVTGSSQLNASIEKIHEFGVKIVLVTMGRKGALAYFGSDFFHIPACKPKKHKDSTGAGDAFIGGFLAEYAKDKDPLWCCCVGSAAASFVVEEVGSQHFGEKKEVYERATKIYEKGIKPVSLNTIEGVCCGKNR